MPVPDYETLMLPVLRLFANGAKNVSECLFDLRQQFDISDEEAAEMLPSGRSTLLSNRAHWARTYLSKAGLLTSPERNLHVVTDLGRQVLAANPERIDNKCLSDFDEFTDWIDSSRDGGGDENIQYYTVRGPTVFIATSNKSETIETRSLVNGCSKDFLPS